MEDRCASCGAKKPEVGEITLASKMGWRLLRRPSDPGTGGTGTGGTGTGGLSLVFEWFCPTCAPKRKL